MRIEELTASVKEIPALPAVTTRVLQLTDDPESTVRDLNDVIAQDQSLTAKVLRLANSAYYGFQRRISSVSEAIVLLGFSTIRSLVLAASVYNLLGRPLAGYALEPGELWKHSQASAMTARLLAQRVKYRHVEQAYTAGLLHDIGKLIMSHHLQKQYQEVVDKVRREALPFTEVEEQLLGYNHATVGARVAQKWNLPADLVETIELHHQPAFSKKNLVLSSITHVADAICMSMGIGLGIDGMYYTFDAKAMETLGLKEDDIEQIMSKVIDSLSDGEALLA
ncbi:MAG: HDOD domain-containing protein [Firmicutes bacterium]|nr:HDOD domain-containing protein [Bacillota bacterium]